MKQLKDSPDKYELGHLDTFNCFDLLYRGEPRCTPWKIIVEIAGRSRSLVTVSPARCPCRGWDL